MKEEELAKLTDQELLDEAKKMKSNSITNALFIGLLIGIVIYSAAKNGLVLVTIIPLFFAYKLIKNSKNTRDLDKILKERNLR